MTITAPISEEQFETLLSNIAPENVQAFLRTRDTTQRAALAREKAERDAARSRQEHTQSTLRTVLAELQSSQAQLAEMRRIVAGFLFNYDDGVGKPWERRLLDYSRKLVDAKEFNAQAEQQEAGHGHVTPRADGVVMKCGGPGLCAGCTAEKEAQGAHAGDDTMEWRLRAMGLNYGKRGNSHCWDHLDKETVTKAADEIARLRAALATQPAAGELVYQYKGLSGEWIETKQAYYEYQKRHGWPVRVLWTAPPVAAGETLALTVWYGSMPESNGKTNWTAILHRKGDGLMDGPHLTIARSEYPDRVRYEADQVRHIIGELAEEPDILAYNADAHSGYTAPPAAAMRAQGGVEVSRG